MKEQPTNEVIVTKLDAFRELTEERLDHINTHLDRLNGQVAKNTKFRIQGRVYLTAAIFVISTVVSLIIKLYA